jgi:hypothetical protein
MFTQAVKVPANLKFLAKFLPLAGIQRVIAASRLKTVTKKMSGIAQFLAVNHDLPTTGSGIDW